ncbi:MAG: uracil-DNA glycosylase family protein [Saprospiraceae bacterium]|nr:uracil-DNA glycosylase family protein [Saprospiraceae bacterium]
MRKIILEAKACTICESQLEHGVRPVFSIHKQSRIAIIGQAPGLKVHQSGVPWDDASGRRLRDWLKVTDKQFYDPQLFAILPMGFCYPGRGVSGDLPPRPECAPQWHPQMLAGMKSIQLKLLVGSYAQSYYLQDRNKLTDRVRNWKSYEPEFIPLPHPSPRNNIWLRKNLWFEKDLIPYLQERVHAII